MSSWQERTYTDKPHALHRTLTASFYISSCEDMCISMILKYDLGASKIWQVVSQENKWNVNWEENSASGLAYTAQEACALQPVRS